MISRPRIAVRTPSRSVAPPTSSQCATLMANAISRLSAKIGRTIAKSQAWAPSRKGSFVTITSPGKIDTPNRSITLRICAPNVPVKSVIPRVWAISSRCALRVRWFQRRSCITTDKLIWFVEMMSGPAFVSPVDRGCCFSVRVKKLMSVRAAPATRAHEFLRQPTIPFARWSPIVEAGDRFSSKDHSLLTTVRSSRPSRFFRGQPSQSNSDDVYGALLSLAMAH